LLERELHVRAGEILTVVPLDVRAQLEGVGLAIGRDRPGGGERRLSVEVLIDPDEAIKDLRADVAGRVAGRGAQVKRLGVGVDRDDGGATALARSRRGWRR